jgi:hypothetical protein
MKAIPVVKEGNLIIGGEVNPIGSAAWAAFLASSPSFRFEQGEDSITVREDRGLWSAFKKRQGKLYRAYVGNLSDKLPEEVTALLAAAVESMQAAYTKDEAAGMFAEKKSEVQKLREAIAEKEADFKQTLAERDAIIKNLSEALRASATNKDLGELLTAIAS